MVKIIFLVLLSEVVTAFGQILFKKSTNDLESYSLRGINAHIRFLRDVLARPSIWLGLASMLAGLVVWLTALAEGDLSLVFSLGSMQYIIILFAAHFFLGEKIERNKIIGTLLVVFGIILVAMS